MERIKSIDRGEVERIAALASLEFSAQEIEELAQDMSKILNYVAMLKKVDVSGVEPMYSVFNENNPLREDRPDDSNPEIEMNSLHLGEDKLFAV